MTEREEIKAQIAALQAKLEAMDAEPDITAGIPEEAIWAGIAAWDKAKHDLENYVSGVTPDWDEGMIVAAIYKAMLPLAPAEPVEGLDWLRKHIAEVDDDNRYWGGPSKREYLSAPEILERLRANQTSDAG